MKFLVDAQLPPSLAHHLRGLGYDAAHVVHHGLRDGDDPEILELARRQGCCVITKDEDFQLHWLFGVRDVPVVWLRCGNISNRDLKARISVLLPQILARLESDETLVEVR